MKASANYIATLLILFLSLSVNAQTLEQIYPEFIADGQTLKEATVGGLSSPQFSAVDLNNDGILDLYIYDKIGQLSLTYLNGGTPNKVDYSYAPAYQKNFPTLVEWVIMRDYNGDGIQDIFTYSSTPGIPGIEVYTGYYTEENQIAFQQNNLSGGQFNIIYYPGNSGNNNLYVSSIDYPAIDDIDGDGDLDIVTFNLAGGIVELFENQSIERGFGIDSLQFTLVDRCWGKFFESGISKEVELSSSPGECAISFTASEPRSGLHAGSTVLTIDLDNDGDKEVILGDISFTNLNLLINGGTSEEAFMTDQDIAFPSNDVSVDLPLFPAAYSLDVNNDGAKDMLVAPNLGNDIGETYEVVWYYENVATTENPVYELRQKDLFVEDMLDYGTGAQPVFVDYNQDGLQDLVVGNKSFFVPGGNRNARVYLYENTGTATVPRYELKEDDLFGLNVFSQNSWRFTPTFGDLDGDGDLDALIGEEFGNLFYAENIAGPDQPFQFAPAVFGYQDLDIGQSSRPQIIDVNRDGVLDLVIGERNGNLNYFENGGTSQNPDFPSDPTNNFFGKVDARETNQVTGYSAPTIMEMEGIFQLFVGSEGGKILQYNGIEGNVGGAFTEVTNNYGDLITGAEIHPAFADIDKDGFLELAVGNIRGGLSFFKTNLKSQLTDITTLSEETFITVAPNPSNEQLAIEVGAAIEPLQLKIYGVNGQVVVNQSFKSSVFIGNLVAGMYVLEIETTKGSYTQKFVKR